MSTDIRVIYFASCDVFDNLALEELLLVERTRKQIVIAFYQNADSVVIGRHQNPWIECDVPALQADRIALARRVSGGGAVYHDRGNLNYSVILARERYDRNAVFDALLSGLARLDVAAVRNERNDILVGGVKVSGTAFRHTKDSTLHHGTLLVDSRLERIERYLHNRRRSERFRGIRSVEARVGCLGNGVTPAVARDALARALSRSLGGRVPETLPNAVPPPRPVYQSRRDERAAWDWVYGATPDFVLDVPYAAVSDAAKLRVHRGRAVEFSIPAVGVALPLPPWRYGRDALEVPWLQARLTTRYPHLAPTTVAAIVAAAVDAWSRQLV